MISNRNAPLLFALLVTVLAAGWRLIDADEWPSPLHPTVQYESALAARAIWCGARPAARTFDRHAWFDAVGFAHVVSPPVLPGLVAGLYAITGEEVPWVSKLFATAFWLAAGWCVRAAALRTSGGRWAASLALAWFVLTPLGIKVSRSFQTEPVLAFALAAAVWLLVRLDRPRWRATLFTAAACGFAALVKPGVLFAPLIVGFAGVLCSAPVPHRLAKLAAFTALTVLPSVAYAACVLPGHVGNKVLPGLLAEWWYYESVEKLVATVAGYGALGLALTGAAFAAANRALLLPGLFVGYAVYLVVFTFHCATHDYYHVPLLVLVAVAMAGPLARLEQRWPTPDQWRFAVAVLALVGYLFVTKNPHLGPWRWTPSARAELARRADEQTRYTATCHAIRNAVGPGSGVIVLGDAYGYPLEYHANIRRAFWPRPADVPILVRVGQLPASFAAEGYLRELVRTRGFDYFAVTDLAALEEQPELRAMLAKWGRVVASGADWVVYDLRAMRAGMR